MVGQGDSRQRPKPLRKPLFGWLRSGSTRTLDELSGEAPARVIQSPKDRERMFFRFFVIDVFVVAIRIAVAVLSNSMAMYATAAKSIISIITAFITWISLRLSGRRENDSYNYGLGKMESLSSIIKGSALLISFAIIVYTSISRLYLPVYMGGHGAAIAIGFSFFFTCGNIYRWLRLRKVMSADERSPVLISQYKATNASIIVNAGSFLAVSLSVLLSGYAWAGYIDPVVSILLSGFILLNAYMIMSSSMGDLLDRSADESIQLIIMGSLAEFFDEYTQVLGIRSRKSGGTLFVEIELEFDSSRSLGDIQAVVDKMQRGLEGKITNSRITIIPRASP